MTLHRPHREGDLRTTTGALRMADSNNRRGHTPNRPRTGEAGELATTTGRTSTEIGARGLREAFFFSRGQTLLNLVQLLHYCVLACTFLAHRRLSQSWGYPPISPTGCTLDGPLEPYHTSFAVPPLEAKSLNAYSAVFSNSARTLPATTGPKLSFRSVADEGPQSASFCIFPLWHPQQSGAH